MGGRTLLLSLLFVISCFCSSCSSCSSCYSCYSCSSCPSCSSCYSCSSCSSCYSCSSCSSCSSWWPADLRRGAEEPGAEALLQLRARPAHPDQEPGHQGVASTVLNTASRAGTGRNRRSS